MLSRFHSTGNIPQIAKIKAGSIRQILRTRSIPVIFAYVLDVLSYRILKQINIPGHSATVPLVNSMKFAAEFLRFCKNT